MTSLSTTETLTSDIGLLIRDMIEGQAFKKHKLDGDEVQEIGEDDVDAVDASDVNNLRVMTASGAVFIVRIVKDTAVSGFNPTMVIRDEIPAQASQDHEVIWLEPKSPDERYGCEGRTWCEDAVWPETEDQPGPTKYIRADIHDATVTRVNKLTELLKAVISDAKAMQCPDSQVNTWFIGFSEYTENPDDPTVAIEWPNLAISVGDAETYLKELEG